MMMLTLDTGFGLIGAYRVDPHGTPRGGLVVMQEIFGVNRHIRSVADRFAAHGYATIAPAVFDLVSPNVQLEYDKAGVARGMQLATAVGVDRAVACVEAAAKALSGSVENVGVVGYCWGGTIAFLCNTRLGLPSVSYYGGRTVQYLHERPQAPLMMHFGEHDAHITPADVQAHRDALPEASIHVYDAGHGFNCEPRHDYNEAAARVALERTLGFFEKVLRP